MVRYVAAATSSWLLAALSLALASTSSQHGVWAIDVDASNGEDLVGGDNTGDGVVSIEPNNAVDNADGSVWSFPEAIVKATGREPIDWKEYLLKDAFGEHQSDVAGSSPTSTSIYPDKPLSRPGLHWGGGGIRGKWTYPMGTCPYGGSMDVDYYGKEKCISVGEAICKNGWRFGIRHDIDNTYLMLWRDDDPAFPVYRWFVGATSLCIGERYPNVAYMRIVFGRNVYYLIGPSAGSADDLARLKIVPDTQKYKPDDVIVKFRDGPGDANTLWQIFANGVSQTSPDALWYPILDPSESPSSNPSSKPSTSPTVSLRPSASPSASPSSSPSSKPSSTFDRQVAVTNYIETVVLGRPLDAETVWMIDSPVPASANAIARDPLGLDYPLPYEETWVAMVDLQPEANFGHDVLVVMIDATFTQYSSFATQLPPAVFEDSGMGMEIPLPCVSGLTTTECTLLASDSVGRRLRALSSAGAGDDCLHAVLISGGWKDNNNYARYPQNLESVYQKINQCGYPADQISTYYTDGSDPLDLDNNATTGNPTPPSDLTGGTTLSAIRGKIQSLCTTLDPEKDVLFIYVTNHGINNTGIALWDFDNDTRLDANEYYSPSQFQSDTANCKVKRLFVVMDQCFSGEFANIANQPTHMNNTAIYTAASSDEVSWGRDYMSGWETVDTSQTLNAMHAAASAAIANSTKTSTPQAAGTSNGDYPLCHCCTEAPSSTPSDVPSPLPSALPSGTPSVSPSSIPSSMPSLSPSDEPSSIPSQVPSSLPTVSPSVSPSAGPTISSMPSVSFMPSSEPSVMPSSIPSNSPSGNPSQEPSSSPSIEPTLEPSSSPSGLPSSSPSAEPSTLPSVAPSSMPSSSPSISPSSEPSVSPSDVPSTLPSVQPSSIPSSSPSISPSNLPSSSPSLAPSSEPSQEPSDVPSSSPSSQPSGIPSSSPSLAPSLSPSDVPSLTPSLSPSGTPSSIPSDAPSLMPSTSLTPSTSPSDVPSLSPSIAPAKSPS